MKSPLDLPSSSHKVTSPHTPLRHHVAAFWSKNRIVAVSIIIGVSLAWTIYDWSRFNLLKERAHDLAIIGAGLAFTELCFIVGALLVAASLGIEIVEKRKIRSWLRHIKHTRSEFKTLAQEILDSKLFLAGFWLNFFGAVGTSLLLIYATIHYAPVAGWGFLILLLVDLSATFGWRIPIHLAWRRRLNNQITVRRARTKDIDDYLRLQDERWNEDNKANRAQLESRLRCFPQGMLVAERAGEIVGMVFAMRITDYDYENPPTWDEITNKGMCDNVDLSGSVIFGVDLSTAVGVGHLAGDELLLGVGRMVISEGVKYAILGGRLPGYHEYADKMSAAEYLEAKNEKGEPLDHQVRFYTNLPGIRALKVLPGYFNDPDSLDYGVLLRWRNPLYALAGRKIWAWLFPFLLRVEKLYLASSKKHA